MLTWYLFSSVSLEPTAKQLLKFCMTQNGIFYSNQLLADHALTDGQERWSVLFDLPGCAFAI